jgi:hypothetical protein
LEALSCTWHLPVDVVHDDVPDHDNGHEGREEVHGEQYEHPDTVKIFRLF